MSLTPYAHYSPMTDTAEMPRYRRGVPVADQPTEVLHLLDLRPAATPTRRRRRFLTRDDLAASWNAALTWTGGITAGVTALALIHVSHLGEVLAAASLGGHL